MPLCECGCGTTTKIADKTRSNRGHVKGQPLRYLNGHGRRSGRDMRLAAKTVAGLEPAFGNWLAGFIDGEGCFTIRRNGRNAPYCPFVLALRVDDAPILYEIAERTGLGRVHESPTLPKAAWGVYAKAECVLLVDLLERHPLRAKKLRDFEIWARAVRAWDAQATGWRDDVCALRDQLISGRSLVPREDWVI